MREMMNCKGVRVFRRSPETGARNLVLNFGEVEVSIAMEIEHDGWKGTSICVSQNGKDLLVNDNASAEDILKALLRADAENQGGSYSLIEPKMAAKKPSKKKSVTKPAVTKPAATKKHSVVCQEWEESEAGWGCRPDGASFHLTEEDRRIYVEAFLKRQQKYFTDAGVKGTPDEYTRTSGGPFLKDVDNKLYLKIKKASKKHHGMMMWQHEYRELKKNG